MDDDALTGEIIGAFHRVYNTMGSGFLEHVYVGALEHECRKRGMVVSREVPIAVQYDGVIVGTYRADLLVERHILVEIKVGAEAKQHYMQLMNYLRCSDLELGLLLHVPDRPNVRRIRRHGSSIHPTAHSPVRSS